MSLATYDNSLFGTATGGNISFSYTVGVNVNTGILLAVYSTNATVTLPSTPTFGGNAMTLVTSNAGPVGTYGSLQIWYYLNASSGSNTVAFNTSSDATTRYYAVFSYYHFKGIDTSAITQNTYSSSFVSQSLTGVANNTLMWAVAGGHDTGGHNLNPTTGTTNTGHTTTDVTMISAGDFGALSSPTSESAQIGVNPGAGNACVALVSILGPQAVTMTAAAGSFTLTGFAATLAKHSNYALHAVVGTFAVTGENAVLTWVRKWINGTKHTDNLTNSTKHTSSWSDSTKHTSVLTDQTKH